MVSELQAGMGDGHDLPVVMIFAVGFEKAFGIEMVRIRAYSRTAIC